MLRHATPWFGAASALQAFRGSSASQAPLQQGRIAVKCMAGLLEAAPHFNYRSGVREGLPLGQACGVTVISWRIA